MKTKNDENQSRGTGSKYYDALPVAESRGVAVSKVMFENEVAATDPARRPAALNAAEARIAELEREMQRERERYAAALSIQEQKEMLLAEKQSIENAITNARGHLAGVADRKSQLEESLSAVIADQFPGRVIEFCGFIAGCETAERVLPRLITAKQKELTGKKSEIAAFLKTHGIKE